MATYLELFDLIADSTLRNKITVSVVKKAQTLIDLATPSANQIKWADNALRNPQATTDRLFPYVLAVNSGVTVATILAASDSAIQTNVDAAADKFILAGLV